MAGNEDKPTGDEVDEVEMEDAELGAVQGGTAASVHARVLQDPAEAHRIIFE